MVILDPRRIFSEALTMGHTDRGAYLLSKDQVHLPFHFRLKAICKLAFHYDCLKYAVRCTKPLFDLKDIPPVQKPTARRCDAHIHYGLPRWPISSGSKNPELRSPERYGRCRTRMEM